MTIRLRNTVMLALLATCSALALAQTPGRVGRISLAQGQVNIGGEVGEQVVHRPGRGGRHGRRPLRVGQVVGQRAECRHVVAVELAPVGHGPTVVTGDGPR